jgi:hypothetical protein
MPINNTASSDPRLLDLARRAAWNSSRTLKNTERAAIAEKLTPAIYDVLSERQRAGETITEEVAFGLIDELVRRMALARSNER